MLDNGPRDFNKHPPNIYLIRMRANYDRESVPHPEYFVNAYDVYLVDVNEATHICSATPSAWLVYCYSDVHTKDETPDEIREELYDFFSEGNEDCYVDMRDVERIIESGEGYFKVKIHPDELGDALEEAATKGVDAGLALLEIYREHYTGNCIL